MREANARVRALPAALRRQLADPDRRRPILRSTALIAIVALLTTAALNTAAEPITAYKTSPLDPHAAARMAATVEADFDVNEPVVVDFSTPMDPTSVEAATTVSPSAPTTATWSDDGKTLQLSPTSAWEPGTFYTVTIGRTAADAAGTPLAAPVRAIFLTRERAAAQLAVTRSVGETAHPDTNIAIGFSAPVEVADVARAFSVDPPMYGTFEASSEPGDDGADRFTWQPSVPLEPGRTYTFRLAGSITDGDDVAIDSPVQLAVTVAARPTVVRAQPAGGAGKVDRDQTISVRFSQPMDRKATRDALRVSGLSPRKDGRVTWADDGRVMIFDPKPTFRFGKKVTISLTGAARSATGVALGEDPAGIVFLSTFTVEPRPKAQPAQTQPASRQRSGGGGGGGGGGGSGSGGGGGGSTSAPWLSVEKYYLKLLNCTRTGGWVQSDGSCKGYGSGNYSAYRKPLSLSSGISSKVARPYAKLMANRNACSHFLDGDPGDRLRRAGYRNWTWGENIGCRSGDPYAAVLASHRYFQNEQDSNGGHWKNIKNPDFSTVGIGVWKADGNVRLVTDFYHP